MTVDDHNILWRFFFHFPIIGHLLAYADEGHSVYEVPFDPQEGHLQYTLGKRFFKSDRSKLLVHYSERSVPKPKGQVVILHGIGEMSARYEHVVQELNNAGFSCLLIDHQGHGLSEGDRCYFQKFDHVIDDIIQLLKICPAPSGVPRFCLGHSMGGLIGLHLVHRTPHLWSGYITSGPALCIDPKIDNPLNRFLASIISSIFPKMVVSKLDSSKVCSDVAIITQYRRDHMVYKGGVRARVGLEMMKAIDRVREWAKSYETPLLIVHGEDDVLCDLKGSQWFMSAAENIEDKTLKVYPNNFHELFQEKIGPTVIQDIIEWMSNNNRLVRKD